MPATDRTLKFGGLPSIVVPVGAIAVSDPIDLSIPLNANLVVSLYFPTSTGPATFFKVRRWILTFPDPEILLT